MGDADFEIEIVYCNVCRKELSIKNGDDFFIETDDSSYVLCEEHWLDFEKDNKLSTLRV